MVLDRIVSRLVIFLVLTIAIEAVSALFFGVLDGYGQAIILLSNVITNPVLHCILFYVSFFISRSAYYYFLVPLEILVVFAEGFIYKKALKTKMNPFLLSFLLNACSYFIGSGILKYL